MKLLMTGRVNQVSISNENRENMMKAIIQEVSLHIVLLFIVFIKSTEIFMLLSLPMVI